MDNKRQRNSESSDIQLLNGPSSQKESESIRTEDVTSSNDARLYVTDNSPGPRTDAGKKRSRLNAVKHGIFSKVALLPGESLTEFDALLDGLYHDLEPKGKLETMLVEKLAVLSWRYRRFLVAETAEIRGRELRLLKLDREERELREANEPFEDGKPYTGLIDKMESPSIFHLCLGVLEEVYKEFIKDGFDSKHAEQGLHHVYGNRRPASLLAEYKWLRVLSKSTDSGKIDPRKSRALAQKFAEHLMQEITQLKDWNVKKAMIEESRLELEAVRRNVPDSPQLDRLLRYEANLERAFDRTLTQLERLQRMRLGQSVTPPIKVDISSS